MDLYLLSAHKLWKMEEVVDMDHDIWQHAYNAIVLMIIYN